ncbi:MAG: NAD-dependent protein deacylase, partial [Oscillospiraceae bacterium]
EESLDGETMERAASVLEDADLLIIGGTSLAVYPAAGLIRYYSGTHLALINRTLTGLNTRADLVIAGSIGEVLGSLSLGEPR